MLFSDKKGREVACPHNSYPIADTHCHLTMLDREGSGSGDRSLFSGTADALARAVFAGVGFVVCVVDPTEDALDPDALFARLARWQEEAAAKIEEMQHDGYALPPAIAALPADKRLPNHVRVSAGCHPHNAAKFTPQAAENLMKLLDNPLVSAIGEIGLDYHYDFSPREVQREMFRTQLRLAHVANMPVALHLREAHDEAYDILKEEGIPERGALLHCFNLGPDEILRFEELGCKFSIGGPVTFNSAQEVRDAVCACRLTSLMTETDAPYMAPAPFRGTQCEPAFTVFSLEKIKQVRSEKLGEDPNEIARILYQNALEFYDGAPASF